MCGIFAYIDHKSNYNEEFIKKQFEKGKSRGPESSKMLIKEYKDTVIMLGFHRLAINGLNQESNQPLCINGIYLICNGEIYNYRNFPSITCVTKSDCEIIIHLYQLYGIDYLFDLLDGVFSFVLYDKNIQKVYVARDPYGVRPLYYNNFIFASEIKQLKNFGTNIKHFEPGTYMELTLDGLYPSFKSKKYSSFGFTKLIFNNLYDIYGVIYQTLYTAVKKRVNTTERPIACLLSGGLDSSTIAALVNSFLPTGLLETYSIGLENSTDLVYAEMVAKHLGTKHTSVIMTEDDFFNSIPETINAIESYDTTTVRASVGNYLIGKYIKEHSNAKVIFNGDGADELMGGYLYFKKAPNEIEFDRECKRLLNNIHCFDVLRSDRCISTHGLEPRTPFLDRSFVQLYLSIPCDLRFQVNQPEKFLLRGAIEFMNKTLIPLEVLYRTKEAFSDGVSGLERSWYQIIQEKVKNTSYKNEQDYYRGIFEQKFAGCGAIVPYIWMPKYTNATDPSARTLIEYK
jgi:asparagine synthase (glutamine-hydrolysing)